MNITTNPDKDFVKEMRKKIADNDGYCPCRIKKTADTKCMCKEFREMMASRTAGYCHCKLYVITTDENDNMEESK